MKDIGAINETEKIMATIKQPQVGDIVILHLSDGDQIQNNQAKEMPAIVTRVFALGPPYTINMKGIPDGPGTIWRTSIMHQQPYPNTHMAQGASWRWPNEELNRGEAEMKATE